MKPNKKWPHAELCNSIIPRLTMEKIPEVDVMLKYKVQEGCEHTILKENGNT